MLQVTQKGRYSDVIISYLVQILKGSDSNEMSLK